MKQFAGFTIAVLALTALSSPRLPAKEIVEIRIHGYYWRAPATVPITIAVEPGTANRALVVEADSDDFYRSSTIELDGENEKRLHLLEFKSLPAGDYVVRAHAGP